MSSLTRLSEPFIRTLNNLNRRHGFILRRRYVVPAYKPDGHLKPGDTLHGYVIDKVVPVPELYLTATMLTHCRTGAHHLHITKEDSNNVFGVAFRTTPMDNTGVPHILEHTALCGSQKFPVRDPFFKMLTRSLATFMNAFTASDWTMYPFSTQNRQDFDNLMSVYLDAVFFPRLRDIDFRQEGWRLEHENIHDHNSTIIFKGVVYNEMKGVFSNSQHWFSQKCQNYLLPSHTYSVISGGDPAFIPDLSVNQLREFHSSHYHPSNSRFYTYGNIPIEDHLEFINKNALQHFDKIDVDTSVPLEPRWTSPSEYKICCNPDPMAPDPNKQITVAVSYLLSDVTDPFETCVLGIIGSLLVNGDKAPFYQSLLESNIGSDYAPNVGYDGNTRASSFTVGLQGVHESDVEKVKDIIDRTFEKVIQDGFEQDRIEAILHQIELSLKHQSEKFGLHLGVSLIPSWIHGGDAPEFLLVNRNVKEFVQRMKENPKFIQDKVMQYFGKENNHRMTLVMYPSDKFEEERQAQEQTKLNSFVNKLSAADKEELLNKGTELAEEQMKVEDLSCLPSLKISDISPDINPTERSINFCGPVPVQLCMQPTNGITYFRAVSDISSLPEHLKPFVPLFCTVITKMGVEGMDFKELSNQIDLKTGGITASTLIAEHPTNINEVEQAITFSSYCLDKNIQQMFDLIEEIFHRPELSDTSRLTTLVNMTAAELSCSLADAGHSYAMNHASSSLTWAGNIKEQMSGMTQVNLVKSLVEGQDYVTLIDIIREIASHILSQNHMRCAINATPENMDEAYTICEKFVSSLPGRSDKMGLSFFTSNEDFVPTWCQTHFELPFQVNFVSRSIKTAMYTNPDYAREKGGAYGGGAGGGTPGVFNFYSYRDPNSVKTLNAFEESIEWASQGSYNQQDIDEAKLSIFQQVDMPVPPANKGMRVFLHHIDDDMFRTHRDHLFAASKESLVDAAQRFLGKEVRTSSVCLLGPRNPATENSGIWQVKAPK